MYYVNNTGIQHELITNNIFDTDKLDSSLNLPNP